MKRTLITAAVSLLEDAACYLGRIPEDAYTQQVQRLSGASVGLLTRSYVAPFLAFAEVLQRSQSQPGVVLNYNCHPCPETVSKQPLSASLCITSLINELPQLIHQDVSWLENTSLLTERPLLIPTTFERELLWNIENTLHHFNLIKIGLAVVTPCIDLPGHFGKGLSLCSGKSERLQLYRSRPATAQKDFGRAGCPDFN